MESLQLRSSIPCLELEYWQDKIQTRYRQVFSEFVNSQDRISQYPESRVCQFNRERRGPKCRIPDQ